MIVYIHIFPNGKRYIGKTVQTVKNRWGINGKRYKTQFVAKAINKYGWDNVKRIVYSVDTIEEMNYLEQYLISYYCTTDKRYGYNITQGGDGSIGYHHTEESRKKMSLSKQGYTPWNKGKTDVFSDELRERMSVIKGTPIKQYTLNLDLIKEYNSSHRAAEITGYNRISIVRAAKREGVYKGYIWKYN